MFLLNMCTEKNDANNLIPYPAGSNDEIKVK